jgi:hypothetical protein
VRALWDRNRDASPCDARAAGHLLNLMNLKRESCEPDRADEAA